MSLWDQVLIAQDSDLKARIVACAASEGVAYPDVWADNHKHRLAASPGWAAKWASALAGEVENPGRDGAVITDGDILAAVQPLARADTQ